MANIRSGKMAAKKISAPGSRSCCPTAFRRLGKRLFFAGAVFLLGLIGGANADVVTGISYIDIPPENVAATSSDSGYWAHYTTLNAATTYDRLWEETGGHGANPNVAGMWLVRTDKWGPDPVPYITYDLGREYDLSEIRIWNWNEDLQVTLDRGTYDFEVRVAGDDGVYGDPVLTDQLALGCGCGGIDGKPIEGGVDFSETFPLAVDGVRYTRIYPLTNWGNGYGTGLSEVRIRERFEVAGVPGDYNNDGSVDAADYTVYMDNLGADASVLNGNGSGGAVVGQADYSHWHSQFGNSVSSGPSASVPEPSTIALGILVAIAALVRQRLR